MDVVGHNVVHFELPSTEESAHYALVQEAQRFFYDPASKPAFNSSIDSDLPVPPCICQGEVFDFSPTRSDGRTAEQTEQKDQSVQQKRENPEEFKGSLFLIGGRADDTFYELLKLAPNNPKVVVVGRASGLPGADESLAEDFFKAGVKLDDITIVIPKDFQPKDTRFKHSYEVPSDADIVYFGGGAQDKLRREFDDHQLEQVQTLLKSGALIAGNSAGTAVMSKEMINGGDERHIEQAHGFGLTPWAILDTHVGQRHRESRDVKALYEIGDGQRPVIGLDEDTRVRFFWKDGKLLGEIGGKGAAKVFQTPEMPPLVVSRQLMSKITSDGGKREAFVWELKEGDTFEVQMPAKSSAPQSTQPEVVLLTKPA
jgi:cyanophycinase